MSDISARFFVLVQKLLPRSLLTAFIFWLARRKIEWLKNFLIWNFVRIYDVNIEEVRLPVPHGFDSFNAFFIRELAVNARPVARAPIPLYRLSMERLVLPVSSRKT